MTAPDRTDELVRAMLERRAGGPVPAWLLDRTMHEVAVAGRARGGPRWRGLIPEHRGARLALAAALVLLLGALVGGAFAAAGFFDRPAEPEPTQPAIVVVPTGSPTPGVAPATPTAPSATAAASPPPTPRPVPDALVADTLAVVATAGDRLRVRTAPGVGEDSLKLEPLLPAGTRMFIASGPVPADGYDWYEVLVDPEQENLYGWVAATGKDGAAWIEPASPSCPDVLDERSLIGINRLDYLVCYGDAEVEVSASRIEPQASDDSPCLAIGLDVCTVEPAWMNAPVWLGLDVGGGETSGLMSVAPPDVYARAASVPRNTPVVLTLAADQPAARDCRYLDGAGKDLVPPARAALACRMQFAVLDLTWGQADVPADSMASVLADELEVWSAPGEASGGARVGVLRAGERVYVDVGATPADGAVWYAILPEDFQNGTYGWVPATQGGRPTLEHVVTDCAPMADWQGFVELGLLGRLVCFGPEPQVLDMWVQDLQAPRPEWSTGCDAYSYSPAPVAGATCEATPVWLATFSGLTVGRPGEMETRAAYDPTVLDRSAFPTQRTWMQVTGSFERPESETCRVRDGATGADLLPPAQAATYCRMTFVVTALGPPTTSP